MILYHYNAISLFCQRFYYLNFCVVLYYNKYNTNEEEMSCVNISKKLKDIRKTKGISVYKLSQLSGVSETHIRDLERGDKNPSIDALSKIVSPLGTSLSDFLNETEGVSYLSEKEKTLVECFRHLSDEKADTLIAFLKTLA